METKESTHDVTKTILPNGVVELKPNSPINGWISSEHFPGKEEVVELLQRIAELEEKLKKTEESRLYWFAQYNEEKAKHDALIKGIDGLIYLAKQNFSYS